MLRDIGFDDPGGDGGVGGGGGGGYIPPPAPGQGWTVNATADTITFSVAPATGTNNIIVNEFVTGTLTGSTKWAIGSWCAAYGFPSEVEFFSDRLWFAGTPTAPQTIWGSQTGDYSHFGRSTPIVDSDAVTFAINARQVNAVMDLVPLDKMIVLAKGGEFLMRGGQDDVITPSTISVKPQSYLGTDGLQSKVAGDTAIFVQEQGQHVFDIGYKFESDGYRPNDLSIWATHLVEGFKITRMEWMPAPWSVLFFARNDGKWIGCTYMPAQEVIGWHRHDTGRDIMGDGDDAIEDIVTLPGSEQTEVFAIVRRTIDGVTERYIEQLASYFVDDIRDWFYVDSGLTYDGRNTTAVTLSLTGGTTWAEGDELVLTSSAPLFSGVGDIGDGFILSNGTDSVRVEIVGYTSTTVVTVGSIGTVPASLRDVALTDWVFQRDTIGGLSHLEGREVAILVDGSVHPTKTVIDGAVALDYPGGVVTVGLPYRAHIETLPLNNPGAQTIMDSKKLLTSVGLLVENTRGVKVCGGPLDPEYLYEIPQREFENYGDPTRPATGYIETGVSADWGQDRGHFHVISDDPLPMEVLGLLPKFLAADKPG